MKSAMIIAWTLFAWIILWYALFSLMNNQDFWGVKNNQENAFIPLPYTQKTQSTTPGFSTQSFQQTPTIIEK